MFGEGELCEPRRYSVLTISVLSWISVSVSFVGFTLTYCMPVATAFIIGTATSVQVPLLFYLFINLCLICL